MTVLILYNEPGIGAPGDLADVDVLTQLEWVREQLLALGHRSQALGLTLDLRPLDRLLRTQAPELVIYLVESLGGTDALLHLPAELLEVYGVPFTGSSAEVLKALASKSAVKRRLLQYGLATPAWLDPQGEFCGEFRAGQYIIKADREHASRGLDSSAVVHASSIEELRQHWVDRSQRLGLSCIAEGFVSGREFNISMLDDGTGQATVLPLAEIDFSALPAGRLPIVDWNAKWSVGSDEFNGTPRTFPDLSAHPALSEELSNAAGHCWQAFGLCGYARVDVRVDAHGRVWILEINANPCLSPDAGFYAASEAAGLQDRIVRKLIAAAGG